MTGGVEGTSGGEGAQIAFLVQTLAQQSQALTTQGEAMATQMKLLTELQKEIAALRRDAQEVKTHSKCGCGLSREQRHPRRG